MPTRRNFITNSLLAVYGLSAMSFKAQAEPRGLLKPKALKKGDTIGLVCPAYSAFLKEEVQIAIEGLQALGFKVKQGKHIFDRYGYLAGKDEDRARDINEMFADNDVNAIMAMHGGWGSARILDLIDYELIKQNPKIFMGYSDITALLLGIYNKTNLVTFHAPVGSSTLNKFTTEYFMNVLVDAREVKMTNPSTKGDNLTKTDDRIYTITAGSATGTLVGGNLTVLSHIIGSNYLPDFNGKILFVEDVNEEIYKIDRMLTQLKLAGILGQISAFIFGKCTECGPSKGGYGSLTLENLFDDHIKPLKIPAYSGAMIGHIKDKFTVPIGIEVTMNANEGSIKFNEPAVLT